MPTESVAPNIQMAVRRWKKKRGNLIMVLHDIQDHYGYVPREASLELARELDVPLARIYEVLTFYNYFKLEPPGKYVISVCTGTACYLKGAAEITEEFGHLLGIEVDKTTDDGLFHLQEVRCLGCCGLAPVVMVNGRIFSKVKPRDAADIIQTCRSEELEAVHG
jgi:NADH-quinone oxidoreductase subunit E